MYQTFATISISIFLEGVFFLLVGVIISAIIERFVSEETIRRIIPSNRFAGLFVASLIGIIFPICECGIVPVVRKLINKGLPLYMGVAVLFSSPIVNIVVLASTSIAFKGIESMVLLRGIGGFIISFLTGLIVSYGRGEALLEGSVHCSCHHHGKSHILHHAVNEFFETGKFFTMGVLITAFMQSVIPASLLKSVGENYPASNLFLMVYPYLLSICSNSDAFIARSFFPRFSISAITGFLIFGAMFDLKTTLMLKKIFRGGFVFKLLLIVFSLVFLYTSIIYLFMKWRGYA